MRYAIWILTAATGWACSCGEYPSAKDAWEGSPLVFVGRVETTDPDDLARQDSAGWIAEQKLRVRVEEPFKGVKTDDAFDLEQPGHNCAPKFKVGQRVLFYLHPAQSKGKWEAYGCHRTRPFDRAAEDLLFLRALPLSATRNRIAGTVSLYENSPASGFRHVKELASVPVIIRGEQRTFELLTGATGAYEIYDLPPGNYRVDLVLPRTHKVRFSIAYGVRGNRRHTQISELPLGPANGVGFDFVVQEDVVVAGRVLDPNGLPLPGVRVDLEPLTTPGNGRHYSYSEEDGAFRIDDMPAGGYHLVANREGRITPQTPFGTTYYPGSADPKKATVLQITPGNKVEQLELRIPAVAKRVAVSGIVQFSDGKPAEKVWIVLADGNHEIRLQKSASDGGFRVLLLAGERAKIYGAMSVFGEHLARCSAYPERTGRSFATFHTPELLITGETGITGAILTLPVPSCPP